LSKLIEKEFGRIGAKLTITLALVAIVLGNTLVLLSRSTCAHGASMDQRYSTVLNGYGVKDPWLNENWAKRRPVTINNANNSNALENYQVLVNVTYDGDMKANFGDLRFCDNDGVTELCYWIENYNTGENAIIWVKVPSIPANDNHTIYMYYGNPGVETESNGSAVFEFFDNFDNATKFSPAAYPYGDPNVAYPDNSNFAEFGNNGNEEYVKLGSYDEGELRENLNLPKENYKIIVKWSTANDQFSLNNGYYTNYDDKYGASTITPKRLIVINENKIYEKDNRLLSYSERAEASYTGAIDNFYLSVGSSGGGGDNPYYTYYDLAFISKSADPEPVTSVGEEESNMAPSAPRLLEPENNSCLNDPTPLFMWEDSMDPEGDSIIYTLEYSTDSTFQTATTISLVNDTYTVPDNEALTDNKYYWRVGARDMVNLDNWSDSFTLRIDTVTPSAPSPVGPDDGANLNTTTPTLSWGTVTDPSTPVLYRCYVDDNSDFSSVENDSGWIIATQYTPNLSESVWYWRVQAMDNAGNVGANSSSRSFRVDVTAPPAPSPVGPDDGANLNTTTPTLSWGTVTDPSTPVLYRCYVDDNSDFSSVENDSGWIIATQYTPKLAEGIWYWLVQAKDNAGNIGANSSSRSFRVDVTAPPAPSLRSPVNGTITNNNTPSFVWDVVTDPSGLTYDLQLDNDPDFTSPEINQTGLTDNTYTPIAELFDENYSWRVRAVDGAGNVGQWSVVWTFLIDTIPPEAPTLRFPENGSLLENIPYVSFKWTKPEPGVIYQIQIDNEASFISPYVHENQSITENSYSYTFAQVGTYYWRVCALDEAGNWSGWSNNFKLTIEVTVGPRTPHYPIRITNDDFFNLDNGVVAGTGSKEDPYIIENWVISAKNANGIEIRNTTACFIIRNCLVENGGKLNNFGIYLESVANGKVENCICENSIYGIYLSDSVINNSIINNTCLNNQHGIILEDSSNNIIANNTCSNNVWYGITLNYYSSNNILDNNNCSNNSYGICIRYLSDNNTVLNNICSNNAYGIGLSSSDSNFIFHNNFLDNASQALDDGSNYWDNGYPSGGNYWSDYNGGDNYWGENQDIPGGDGIGDTPYFISGGSNADHYPIMNPPPPIRGVEVSISPSRQGGLPGAMLIYIVDVMNTSTVDDTYSLTVIDNAGWGLLLADNLLENVSPSVSRATTLKVTIPDNESLIGVKDYITVTATSRADNTTSDNVVCTALAENENEFYLSLFDGWNFVGFTFVNENTTPINMFGSNLKTMKYWAAPGGPYKDANYSAPVHDNIGYWVQLKNDQDVILSGVPLTSRTLYLVAGWNLVHFPLTSASTTPINMFGNNLKTMKYWTAPGGPYKDANYSAPVVPGVGYWIQLKNDENVTVPL
jgi:parallel beta-helix repeat protein